MTPNLNIEPDIKVSIKQSFGIDTKMEVDAFQKKVNMFLKLIKIINLIKIQHLQLFQDLHLIKEFWFKVIMEQENQLT